MDSSNQNAPSSGEQSKSRNRNRGFKRGSKAKSGKSPAPEDASGQSRSGDDLNSRRLRNRPGKKSKEPAEDRRLGEVSKLIKRYIPITVNGLAVSSILHPKPSSNQKDGEDVKHQPPVKKLSKAEKLTIITSHIRRVIDKDPKQPLYLSFILIPSDPDFPFELELLNFNLTIPGTYPKSSSTVPSLLVLNTDIPRGYAVNIERLYADIARLALGVNINNPELALVNGKGLLSQIQTLDKYLEIALKQEKKATMKFVSFKHSSPSPAPTSEESTQRKEQKKLEPSKDTLSNLKAQQIKTVGSHRLKGAQDARNLVVERMVSKLGSLVRLFYKSDKEERYKILVPVIGNKSPQLWSFENETIDVFVSIPEDFPEINPKVNIAANFSNNLMVAKRSKLEARGLSLLKLVEEARSAEKNFKSNINEWLDEQSQSTRSEPLFLVTLVNRIANDLQYLLQPKSEYLQWQILSQELKEQMVN